MTGGEFDLRLLLRLRLYPITCGSLLTLTSTRTATLPIEDARLR